MRCVDCLDLEDPSSCGSCNGTGITTHRKVDAVPAEKHEGTSTYLHCPVCKVTVKDPNDCPVCRGKGI